VAAVEKAHVAVQAEHVAAVGDDEPAVDAFAAEENLEAVRPARAGIADDHGRVARGGGVADDAAAVGQRAAAEDAQGVEERVAADDVAAVAGPVADDAADGVGLEVGSELAP